jgi:hypothetical protein
MRRGAVIVRVGEGMPMIKRCGVDLARQSCADDDADEQKGQRLASVMGDNW